MPWMRCGPALPPDNTADPRGSTAIKRTSGKRRRSTWPTPVSVPPDADAGDEGIDAGRQRPSPVDVIACRRQLIDLRQDLGAGGADVGLGIVGVSELLRHEIAAVAARELFGPLDGPGHVEALGCQHQIGTIGLEQAAALRLIDSGMGQQQLVALDGADDGQADAGIARGRLDDDRLAGADQTVALGGLDHR